MNFKTLNKTYTEVLEKKNLPPGIKKLNRGVDFVGTGLRGYIKTKFDDITGALGEPEYLPEDDKVPVRWSIEFVDGQIATIYVYKEEDVPKEEHIWHIGGKRKVNVQWLKNGVPNWQQILMDIVEGKKEKPEHMDPSMIHPHFTYLEWEELPAKMKNAIYAEVEIEEDQKLIDKIAKLIPNRGAAVMSKRKQLY